jgi:Uma2 family endonuclease
VAAPAEFLLPDHHGPWTLGDVLALPEDHSQRVELVDGMLVVSPFGDFRHQCLIGACFSALTAVAPAELEPTVELNVGLSGGRLLIPDFTVVGRTDFGGEVFPVEHVVLVGEVISPSTRVKDLVLKRQLYAEAGVPFYLVVDPKGLTFLLELRGVEYVEVARAADGVLVLDRPFPVTIALTG